MDRHESSRRNFPSGSTSRWSSKTNRAQARRSAPSSLRNPRRTAYTLLLASQTNAIIATLYSQLKFHPLDDFVPISLIGREPGVLVVHPSLPVQSIQELITYTRERPSQLDYASSATAAASICFAALFLTQTGLNMNHIPYRGSGQATTDLLGGQVMVSFPGVAGMLGHIKAGKLRALAVTSATRSPQLPDVPTIAEAAVPGYAAYVWLGLMAPKGTPAPIIEKLHREVLNAMATSEVKTYMANASIEVVGSTPAEFGTFFREEIDRWRKSSKENRCQD